MERNVQWGWVWVGLGSIAIVALTCILVAASDTPTSHTFNSAWLFVLLPVGMTIAGAVLLAGREP